MSAGVRLTTEGCIYPSERAVLVAGVVQGYVLRDMADPAIWVAVRDHALTAPETLHGSRREAVASLVARAASAREEEA